MEREGNITSQDEVKLVLQAHKNGSSTTKSEIKAWNRKQNFLLA